MALALITQEDWYAIKRRNQSQPKKITFVLEFYANQQNDNYKNNGTRIIKCLVNTHIALISRNKIDIIITAVNPRFVAKCFIFQYTVSVHKPKSPFHLKKENELECIICQLFYIKKRILLECRNVAVSLASGFVEGCLRGVVCNILDCNILISKFELSHVITFTFSLFMLLRSLSAFWKARTHLSLQLWV